MLFIGDESKLRRHGEVSDRYVDCFVYFSEEGELIKDIELFVHFGDHSWTHLHQLPKWEIFKLALFLFAKAVGGELQLLLEHCDWLLGFVEQLLNILLNLTAILILKITNIL